MSTKTPATEYAEAYRKEWWNHELGWASPAHRQTYITMLQNNLASCNRLANSLEDKIAFLRERLYDEGVLPQ